MAIGQYYTDASVCSHEHPEETIRAIDLSAWTATITQIAKDLFNGKLNPLDLHKGLIAKTYKELNDGAALGFGVTYKTDAVGKMMQKHLYKFSVAKTYKQLVQMQGFLVDENGKLRSYTDFEKKVQGVHEKFNKTYLESEYRTVKRSSQAARQWGQFEADKDLFPNLIYRIVADDKVRDEHKKLNGTIKAVDDVFWDSWYPPNGHRCRCGVQQTTKSTTGALPKVEPAKGFANNVGKTGQAFDEKGHPYFTMPKDAQKAVKKHLDGKK